MIWLAVNYLNICFLWTPTRPFDWSMVGDVFSTIRWHNGQVWNLSSADSGIAAMKSIYIILYRTNSSNSVYITYSINTVNFNINWRIQITWTSPVILFLWVGPVPMEGRGATFCLIFAHTQKFFLLYEKRKDVCHATILYTVGTTSACGSDPPPT